jgi:hypothetical protein
MKTYSAQINLLPFLCVARESLQTRDHSTSNHPKQYTLHISNLRSPNFLYSCMHFCCILGVPGIRSLLVGLRDNFYEVYPIVSGYFNILYIYSTVERNNFLLLSLMPLLWAIIRHKST